MAEMPNVIGGETITSDWGNDVRDRSIQRYVNNADRAALNPTPTAGDLAYMQDSGRVAVYHSGTWRTVGVEEVDDAATVASVTTTTSYTTLVSAAVSIPTYWTQWKCYAEVHWVHRANGVGSTIGEYILQIDGTGGAILNTEPSNLDQTASYGWRRTGITTTGSRVIQLAAKHTGLSITCLALSLYARAVRTG